MRYTGVTARGIVAPIFKEGDDLATMVCDCVINASENEGFKISDGDIIGVTEAVVGRTQGNYATCDQIAADINAKFEGDSLGILFPILSRNRFSILLKGFAMSGKKLYVQLSYPGDEVGNSFVSLDMLDEKGIKPYSDSFDEDGFRALFGKNTLHQFTGVDYIELYKSFSDTTEIILSNDPAYLLRYTENILCCDIHSRKRTKRLVEKAGGKTVLCLDDLLTVPVDGSGRSEYGLLGSNKATEDKVKLFPRDTDRFVEDVASEMRKRTGKRVEVLVYGDGGFKDPQGGIWELADPVISPAHTDGLLGTPNELKIKYIADNELAHLSGNELAAAIRGKIKEKEGSLVGDMRSEGTTPRQITDLVGSLCDLVSGSGDRGTPIVVVQNYFTNYATE